MNNLTQKIDKNFIKRIELVSGLNKNNHPEFKLIQDDLTESDLRKILKKEKEKNRFAFLNIVYTKPNLKGEEQERWIEENEIEFYLFNKIT